MTSSHLLSINDLTALQAVHLIQRAFELKQKNWNEYPSYHHHPTATLFYENSTRTLMSFQAAAQRLSLPLSALNTQVSSEKKGESFLDTLKNLHAMGFRSLIIRHPANDPYQTILDDCPKDIHIINAGDGQNEHPTQAWLDMMTIMHQHPEPQHLKITLVGDIRHSRVAHSFQKLAHQLHLQPPVMVAPKIWKPEALVYGQWTEHLKEGLEDADVIMMLRVQNERLLEHEQLDLTTFHQNYGLTRQKLTWAKPNAMVLHPGPINRGVEITSEVADGPQSWILKQVEHGVFLRMAALEHLIQSGSNSI